MSTEKGNGKSLWSKPVEICDIEVPDLTKKEILVIAYEAAKTLKWDIVETEESGFTAYTPFSMKSWSEEVEISIEEENIKFQSQCTVTQRTDWGKNKNNAEAFVAKFNEVKDKLEQLNIEEIYQELIATFNKSEENLQTLTDVQNDNQAGLLSLFFSSKGIIITSVIMLLNIAVFILMAVSGVDLFSPSSANLITWGANIQYLTADGERWRLFSSIFLHIGIVHLFLNMYALLFVGLILEPVLGRSRFLSAYLLTGLAGSVASVYWNDFVVSAGASGAIFGMYGVLLALLNTNLFNLSARRGLLFSIVPFVVYNLIFGLTGGVDNAAHIGGLLAGLLIGYSFYPGLRKPDLKIKALTIGLLSILFATGAYFVMENNSSSDLDLYEKEIMLFKEYEQKALTVHNLASFSSDKEAAMKIKSVGIENWEKCLDLLDKMEKYRLPDFVHARNQKLVEYCKLRIKVCELLIKSINEATNIHNADMFVYNMEIKKIITELNQMN